MCEIIKHHVKDLLIITESARKYYTSDVVSNDNIAHAEHLKNKYGIFGPNIYGFHAALKIVEEDFNALEK